MEIMSISRDSEHYPQDPLKSVAKEFNTYSLISFQEQNNGYVFHAYEKAKITPRNQSRYPQEINNTK